MLQIFKNFKHNGYYGLHKGAQSNTFRKSFVYLLRGTLWLNAFQTKIPEINFRDWCFILKNDNDKSNLYSKNPLIFSKKFRSLLSGFGSKFFDLANFSIVAFSSLVKTLGTQTLIVTSKSPFP